MKMTMALLFLSPRCRCSRHLRYYQGSWPCYILLLLLALASSYAFHGVVPSTVTRTIPSSSSCSFLMRTPPPSPLLLHKPFAFDTSSSSAARTSVWKPSPLRSTQVDTTAAPTKNKPLSLSSYKNEGHRLSSLVVPAKKLFARKKEALSWSSSRPFFLSSSSPSTLSSWLPSYESATLTLSNALARVGNGCTLSNAMQYWWMTPMLLCFVPVLGSPETPHFWKMVDLSCLHHRAPATAAAFLLSNVVYFATGAFLWQSHKKSSKTPISKSQSQRDPPRKNVKGLAGWSCAAGAVSTLFHAHQALGRNVAVAEAWCYVDHGLAGTAILYFWRECGMPRRKRIWAAALLSFMVLAWPVAPETAYAYCHATWHGLSAATAALWAQQKKGQKHRPMIANSGAQRQQREQGQPVLFTNKSRSM